MKRREFVRHSTISLPLFTFSGCSSVSRDNRAIRIERITLANFDESEAKKLTLKIIYDGSEIHNETYTVPSEKNQIAGTVRITGLPKEPGEYAFRTSLESQSKTKYVDISLPKSRTCANFDIQMFDSGEIGLLSRECDSTN